MYGHLSMRVSISLPPQDTLDMVSERAYALNPHGSPPPMTEAGRALCKRVADAAASAKDRITRDRCVQAIEIARVDLFLCNYC